MPRWRSLESVARLAAILPLAAFVVSTSGCSTASDDDRASAGFEADAPHLTDALFVDIDGGGSGSGDVVVLRFDKPVILQGESAEGLVPDGANESLGDGATLAQSQPGSQRVELVLGENARITPLSTRLNVASSGEGIVQIVSLEDVPTQRASPSKKSVQVTDITATAPVLLDSRLVDSDGDGALGAGDRIVASFNKPIFVPPGAVVADNFTLPVAGDSFGASPTLASGTRLATNRVAEVTLGAGAVITPDGLLDAGSVAAGTPSGLVVAPGPDITDTVAGAPNALSPGASADISGSTAVLFGDGRRADTVLGTTDAFAARLTAQGLDDPAGLDQFSGSLTVGGETFPVRLLFAADRGNDRVLVFADFPSGTFASATWVLGKGDFEESTSDDPTVPVPASPGPANLSGPTDAAFDAASNSLYVSDTGNHRVLVWLDLFSGDGGALSLANGKAASFALGQPSFFTGRANRGAGAPSSSSLSSPRGLDIDAGRLAIADSGNHRVVLYGSLPRSSSASPSTVLGQASFDSGLRNRGGLVAANTLSEPSDVFLSSTFQLNGSTGAVLVADTGNHRVCGFNASSPASGADAAVALGQADLVTGDPALTAAGLSSPAGVKADAASGRIYVADSGNHRLMTYNAGGPIANGAAGVAIGQASATAGSPNRGGPPGADTLSGPTAVELAGTALVASDSGNHRILVYEGLALPTADLPATIVLGQESFAGSSPQGRRLNQPSDALVIGGRLIVTDTGNHRVLIYNSVSLEGDPDPDVVLGQPDLSSTLPNAGGTATLATLRLPTSVATDGTRLAVADTGNHRILIWAAIPTVTGEAASVILGQPALDVLPNAGQAPSARTLSSPEGLAVDSDRLFVADRDNHRVLVYPGLSGITTFAPATIVIGQHGFEDVDANRGESVRGDTLKSPRDVLVGGGRLYVADSGNHRVLVWSKVPSGSGSSASGVFGQQSLTSGVEAGASADSLAEPAGLAMDPLGEVLVVSDTAHNRVVFFRSTTGKDASERSASSVLGQATLVSGSARDPGLTTLASPRGLFFNGRELYAADSGTSRVAVFR